MHLNAHLDFDLVAVEHADELTLMLELKAPAAPDLERREPATLQVVLDRSGSMAGDRLVTALVALDALVGRLDEHDSFGLVTFDDEVQVVVPAAPLTDKERVRAALRMIGPGGSTNISGGYGRGIQEARRAASKTGATLLLLSDGMANCGVTDPGQLEDFAQGAQGHGVSTSTLGIGLGYDEVLLGAIARGGGGSALFAEEPDTAAVQIAGEVEGLLSLSAQAASLVIRPSGDVASVHLHNDLPASVLEDGVMIELGDLRHEEERRLVITFGVPAMSELGLAQVAELTLSYLELPSLSSHTITVPVNVNVIPGDQAAGRIANPVVVSERVFQRAQEAKRLAAEQLRAGEESAAAGTYRTSAQEIAGLMACAPPERRAELTAEAALLEELAERVEWDEHARILKFSESDRSRKTRQRGRER